ncbi:hypothetical protein SDC9_18899 [bioreactor metagenome]|uniref:Uncharacterized protein n=1 Tax=bioreactor metagenome TaxID=1076179 RepID=A0A644U1I2_9ZZZZ
MGPDLPFERVVQRLGHRRGIAVRHRRLDQNAEAQPVGLADRVDRDQVGLQLQRQLGRRGGGLRRTSEEGQMCALAEELVEAESHHAARAQEAQHRLQIVVAGEERRRDGRDRAQVMAVEQRVAHRPVDRADAIAAPGQRAAPGVVIAEMPGRDDHRPAFVMGGLQRRGARAFKRQVAHPGEEFLAGIDLGERAADIVGHRAHQPLDLGLREFRAGQGKVRADPPAPARDWRHQMRHRPAHHRHPPLVGQAARKRHQATEHRVGEAVGQAGVRVFGHRSLCGLALAIPDIETRPDDHKRTGHRPGVGQLAEEDKAPQAGEDQAEIAEGREGRGLAQAEGAHDERLAGAAQHAKRQEDREIGHRHFLPDEGQGDRAEHGADQRRPDQRGGERVGAHDAGEQVARGIAEGRGEGEGGGGLEGTDARAQDHQRAEEGDDDAGDAARPDPLAQEQRRAERDQDRIDVEERIRLGQTDVTDGDEEEHDGDHLHHPARRLRERLAGAQARQEGAAIDERHQREVDREARPDQLRRVVAGDEILRHRVHQREGRERAEQEQHAEPRGTPPGRCRLINGRGGRLRPPRFILDLGRAQSRLFTFSATASAVMPNS